MDNFWTDELVKEFINSFFYSDKSAHIDAFKKSKQKTYEILSFIGVCGCVPNAIYKLGKDGVYDVFYGTPNHSCWTLDNLIQRKMEIYSVKRLSDGEVFSLGDYCFHGPIKRFCLKGEGIWADFESGDVGCSIRLDDLKKDRKPLFTTEDGKTVYDGDRYYVVITRKGHGYDPYTVAWCSEGEIETAEYKNNAKFFSDKEKANEYILMNKPCLSLKDIESVDHAKNGNIACIRLSKLTELIKSKL